MIQEIEEAVVKASQIYPAVHQKPYLDGGIFGYKLAIDKACEWLKNYDPNDYLREVDDYYELDERKVINDFKKAMKGD